MSGSAVKEGFSPVWADYLWLARGDGSRLYFTIREFILAIESASRSVGLEALDNYKRRIERPMSKFRLKYFLYSACGFGVKQEKYRYRILNELRAMRDAALNISVGSIEGGTLTQILGRCGSDKGGGRHNYSLLYELLFRDGRERVARIFELGIGSFGPNHAPGASLKGWREYFPNAFIFGGDIDVRLLFQEDRIRTALVDQTDPESVDRLFKQMGNQFDLIIEDGCHQVEASRVFFERAFSNLKDTGFYIIEDVVSGRRNEYKAFLSRYDAAILHIPHDSNHDDNCLAIVVKD